MLTKRLVPVMLLLLTAGCAQMHGPVRTYDGPSRPHEQVARVIAPVALEVLKADGKKLKLPYTPGGEYEVHLLPGPHRLSVAYREVWGDATNSTVIVSDAMIFDLEVNAGQRLRLAYREPVDVVDAQRFASNPEIWMVDADSAARIDPVDVTDHGNLFTQAVRRAVAGPPAAASQPADAPSSAAAADPLAQLKIWWGRAEPADRAAFRTWLDYQE